MLEFEHLADDELQILYEERINVLNNEMRQAKTKLVGTLNDIISEITLISAELEQRGIYAE